MDHKHKPFQHDNTLPVSLSPEDPLLTFSSHAGTLQDYHRIHPVTYLHLSCFAACTMLFCHWFVQQKKTVDHKYLHFPSKKGKCKVIPVTGPVVAQRVGRGIALLLHDRGTRSGRVVSSTPCPHFTPRKDPVPIVQEAGWAPGPVWTGGKYCPTGIRSPNRAAHIQSLYRLSSPTHTFSQWKEVTRKL